jgi:TPR repeat protein
MLFQERKPKAPANDAKPVDRHNVMAAEGREVVERVRTAIREPGASHRSEESEAEVIRSAIPAVKDHNVGNDSRMPEELERATAIDNPNGSVRLANMYLKGEAVGRSCDQALTILESAATQPNVRARKRLALLYEIGVCVQRDRVQAYRWLALALAADPNDEWAQQNRDLTWGQMTSEERRLAVTPE